MGDAVNKQFLMILLFTSLLLTPLSEAKKSSGSSSKSYSTKSSAPKYGTGSNPSSTNVKGHTTKNGTYVAPSKRSAPDSKLNNNWSTGGNTNPYTGKAGTKAGSAAGN